MEDQIGDKRLVKQEIAANCKKYIRAKDTQVSPMIFSSEFKFRFSLIHIRIDRSLQSFSHNTLVTAMLL